MAKRNTKKQTYNQREYARQVSRIKRAMSRAEKRGYMFDKSIIAQTPKRVTKSLLTKLQDLRGNKLYEKAIYVDTSTGEILKGTEGRTLERQESARKAAETRIRNRQQEQPYYPKGGSIVFSNVVEQFIERLSEPPREIYVNRWGKKSRKNERTIEESERAKHTLLSITNSVIEKEGKEAVGWRLEANSDEVNLLIQYILYGSESSAIASACSRLASILNGGALSMEQLQDIAEQEEYNEDYEQPE